MTVKRSIDAATEGLADEGLTGTTDKVPIDDDLTEGLLTDEELRKGEGQTDEQELADGRIDRRTDRRTGPTGKGTIGILTEGELAKAKKGSGQGEK